AEDPEKNKGEEVGYDLLPLYSSFWTKARGLESPNQTFGDLLDFGDLFCRELVQAVLRRMPSGACRLGRIGVALRGDVAGKNRALLPWGWNSPQEPQIAAGDWFLNPVHLMRVRYPDAESSDVYVSNPFLGIFRNQDADKR